MSHLAAILDVSSGTEVYNDVVYVTSFSELDVVDIKSLFLGKLSRTEPDDDVDDVTSFSVRDIVDTQDKSQVTLVILGDGAIDAAGSSFS